MHEVTLLPHAASLSQSMRDIGYSLETAIADLIDNSITAKASEIQIRLELTEAVEPCLVIVDNGTSMTETQLLEAMRHGSRDPRAKRSADDLGRFGLGLKTASFSQCKSLTVACRKSGKLHAAQWDLDLINARNEWVVNVLTAEEIKCLPHFDLLEGQGTYVLWQKLDRLIESSANERNRDAYDKLEVVERHLSLVFHRYLSGDFKNRKIAILINGKAIKAFDPYCMSNKATQLLPEEIVRIDGNEVKIQPYILPHHSKLSKEEYEFYKSRSDFVSNQGAYVYRNGRLMAWGDWFRLVPKTEATKLARVKIDFTNVLDERWTIDIKKSRAYPPHPVREKLRQIIDRVVEQSRRVHQGRAEKSSKRQEYPFWVRNPERLSIRYSINRQHPLIITLQSRLDEETSIAFKNILSLIEQSLPLETIYADYSSSPQSFEEKPEIEYQELKEQLQQLHTFMCSSGVLTNEQFARMVSGLKPFSENRKITQKILEELM